MEIVSDAFFIYTNQSLKDAITKTKAKIHFTFWLEAILEPHKAPMNPPINEAMSQ